MKLLSYYRSSLFLEFSRVILAILLLLSPFHTTGCAKKEKILENKFVRTQASGEVKFRSSTLNKDIVAKTQDERGKPISNVDVQFLVTKKHVVIMARDPQGKYFPDIYVGRPNDFEQKRASISLVGNAHASPAIVSIPTAVAATVVFTLVSVAAIQITVGYIAPIISPVIVGGLDTISSAISSFMQPSVTDFKGTPEAITTQLQKENLKSGTMKIDIPEMQDALWVKFALPDFSDIVKQEFTKELLEEISELGLSILTGQEYEIEVHIVPIFNIAIVVKCEPVKKRAEVADEKKVIKKPVTVTKQSPRDLKMRQIDCSKIFERHGIHYEAGKTTPYTGSILCYHTNGKIKYEGYLKNGKEDRLWTFYQENGLKYYEGHYENGELEGLWTEWHENGEKKQERYYENGVMNGKATSWHDNGRKKAQVTFINGEKHGIYKDWHRNGQLKEQEQYKHGILDGLCVSYYDNKNKEYERTYVNGKLDGKAMKWYRNGNKIRLANYKNDEQKGKIIEWYKNGNIKTEDYVENGRREGLFKAYYESGGLKMTEMYKNGKPHGLYTYYYKNGKKANEVNYVNFKRHGKATYWDKNGKVSKVIYFENGRVIR